MSKDCRCVVAGCCCGAARGRGRKRLGWQWVLHGLLRRGAPLLLRFTWRTYLTHCKALAFTDAQSLDAILKCWQPRLRLGSKQRSASCHPDVSSQSDAAPHTASRFLALCSAHTVMMSCATGTIWPMAWPRQPPNRTPALRPNPVPHLAPAPIQPTEGVASCPCDNTRLVPYIATSGECSAYPGDSGSH